VFYNGKNYTLKGKERLAVEKDFRDVIGVRNPVAIGALAVLGMVITIPIVVLMSIFIYFIALMVAVSMHLA